MAKIEQKGKIIKRPVNQQFTGPNDIFVNWLVSGFKINTQ